MRNVRYGKNDIYKHFLYTPPYAPYTPRKGDKYILMYMYMYDVTYVT